MTREEQLKSCTICTHRCMDMHKGLLCGLTQNAANFEGECPNFEQDEKEVQKQEYKRHGYKRKREKERNLAFTNYNTEAIRAAREYAEGLFTPEEVKDPEWGGSIDYYAMNFEDGADWYKLTRGVSYEEIEEAANQYGRKMVEASDADISTMEADEYADAIDDAAMGFIEGAEWCDEYLDAKHADICRCLCWGVLALWGVFFISLIIFSQK